MLTRRSLLSRALGAFAGASLVAVSRWLPIGETELDVAFKPEYGIDWEAYTSPGPVLTREMFDEILANTWIQPRYPNEPTILDRRHLP